MIILAYTLLLFALQPLYMNRYTTVFFALSLLALGACNRFCTRPQPAIKFTNYDSATLESVIVRAYSKNANQPELMSTTYYSSRRYTSYDTITIDTSYQNIILEYYYDYTVTIPATGRVYSIKKININEDKGRDIECTSSWSYYLNDSLYNRAVVPVRNHPSYINITL